VVWLLSRGQGEQWESNIIAAMCIAGDAVRNTGDAGSHMKILIGYKEDTPRK
jgi:hypothetical protein